MCGRYSEFRKGCYLIGTWLVFWLVSRRPAPKPPNIFKIKLVIKLIKLFIKLGRNNLISVQTLPVKSEIRTASASLRFASKFISVETMPLKARKSQSLCLASLCQQDLFLFKHWPVKFGKCQSFYLASLCQQDSFSFKLWPVNVGKSQIASASLRSASIVFRQRKEHMSSYLNNLSNEPSFINICRVDISINTGRLNN